MVNKICLAATLAGFLIFLSVRIGALLSAIPFTVAGHPNPDLTDLVTVLDGKSSNGSLKPGAAVDVAFLRKNDGSVLTFTVAEGTFNNSSIEPRDVWSNLLYDPTVIVSSGDQNLDNDGGISQPIGIGCNIQKENALIPTGATVMSPCSGNYAKLFPNVFYVASAVIVAWKGVAETPICTPDAGDLIASTQSQEIKCFQKAIESSLEHLFAKPQMTKINTLVLPALGTGVGKLPKGDFYRSATNAIEKCLDNSGCLLPQRIIFLVRSGDTSGEDWQSIRDAIARNLFDLGDDWRLQYAPSTSLQKPARYSGVILVLLATTLLMLFRKHLPHGIAVRLPITEGTSLWLLIFGWGLVASGLFSVLSDPMDVLLPNSSAITVWDCAINVGFGAIAAAGCSLIQRATRAFDPS